MNLQTFIAEFIDFANNIVIPFLLGMAFLLFVINVFRFFIFGGANQEGKEKARALAVYGILAFVFIMIFWGLVNMFSSSLGLSNRTGVSSDYVEDNNGGTNLPSDCSNGNPFDPSNNAC